MHEYFFFFSTAAEQATKAPSGGGGSSGTSLRKRQRLYFEPAEVREVVRTAKKQRRLPETLDPGDSVRVAEQIALLSSLGEWSIRNAIRDLRTLEQVAPVMYRPQIAAIRGAVEDDEEALLLLL